MNIITWNIGDYKSKCESFSSKFRVLRSLVRNEKPDVFCIIEGTKSKKTNRLLKSLFKTEGYNCYYDPTIPKNISGIYDWDNFEPFGLKIFLNTKTFDNYPILIPSSVLFKGRLIKLELNSNLFIFLHRNRSASKFEQDDFIGQIRKWIEMRNQDKIKNVFILGDFNLNIWDEHYFSENSGYIQSTVIKPKYDIWNRENTFDFYNPIIETINNLNRTNLAGTYYNSNNKYGWEILDYILIKNWNPCSISVDIPTNFGDYDLIESELSSTKYIKYEFDHLPIKLSVK